MEKVISEHIEIRQDIFGGKPCIAGHRIRVQDIAVLYEKLGLSPDEIISTYPTISLAEVHTALAYYYDNREKIDQDIRSEDALVTELKKRYPSKMPG